MKHFIFLLILLVAISFDLFASNSGSCNFPKAGQCLRFSPIVTDSERKTTCGQMSEAVYINGQCPVQGIVGKCKLGDLGRTADLVFYLPQWTIETAKIRCTKMKGSYN